MRIAHRISAEDRRNQILDVATHLFARQGFEGTTTRAIAERAGVNEAIIFRHFPSKEVLYRAVLEKNARESGLATSIRTILERDGELRESMIEIATTVLRSRISSPTLTRLFLYSALEGHELSNQFLRSYLMSSITDMSDFLRSHMERGVLRDGNPVTIARCFFGMLTHYILLHDLFIGEGSWAQDPAAVASEIVGIWLDGILPKDSPLRDCPRRPRSGHRVTKVRSNAL